MSGTPPFHKLGLKLALCESKSRVWTSQGDKVGSFTSTDVLRICDVCVWLVHRTMRTPQHDAFLFGVPLKPHNKKGAPSQKTPPCCVTLRLFFLCFRVLFVCHWSKLFKLLPERRGSRRECTFQPALSPNSETCLGVRRCGRARVPFHTQAKGRRFKRWLWVKTNGTILG